MNIHEVEALAWTRNDLAYHQLRVLLLVNAVASRKGHQRKLDGLTKLAKLDFLTRYPAIAPRVLDSLDPRDPRLALREGTLEDPTDVEDPMIRYKFGPWDNRYYPVIGALVARGLLRYAKGRMGSVALAVTKPGQQFADALRGSPEWAEFASRADAVAEASEGLTGTALKDLIYARLPDLMDRPHRDVIR